MFTVSPRRRKRKLPSPVAEENKQKTRPVPPREETFTILSRRRKKDLPSRRGKQYLPSRPAEAKNIYRPVPSRKSSPWRVLPSSPVEKIRTRCPVRPTFHVFILPSRCHFFSSQTSKICPVPFRHDSSSLWSALVFVIKG